MIIMKGIAQGKRVREYVGDGKDKDGAWVRPRDEISIGHKHIQRFDPKEVSTVRLWGKKSMARPFICRFAAYSVGR